MFFFGGGFLGYWVVNIVNDVALIIPGSNELKTENWFAVEN